MVIRKTKTASKNEQESYITYRLVVSERINGAVKQKTLLNLGSNCTIPPNDWPLLCARMDQIISKQTTAFKFSLPSTLEQCAQHYAQHYAGPLIAQQPALKESTVATFPQHPDFRTVDMNSLDVS